MVRFSKYIVMLIFLMGVEALILYNYPSKI